MGNLLWFSKEEIPEYIPKFCNTLPSTSGNAKADLPYHQEITFLHFTRPVIATSKFKLMTSEIWHVLLSSWQWWRKKVKQISAVHLKALWGSEALIPTIVLPWVPHVHSKKGNFGIKDQNPFTPCLLASEGRALWSDWKLGSAAQHDPG